MENAPRRSVAPDGQDRTLTDEPRRILEIRFKNGQTWQLKGVPPEIYQEFLHQTLSSFLKFIAHKYQANPVKSQPDKESIPSTEPCPDCKTPMTVQHQTSPRPPARVLWKCDPATRPSGRATGKTPSEKEKHDGTDNGRSAKYLRQSSRETSWTGSPFGLARGHCVRERILWRTIAP